MPFVTSPGLYGVCIGVSNQSEVCEVTHGATTTDWGCAGDTSAIVWGGKLAILGGVFTMVTLAVGALSAAVRSRGADLLPADAVVAPADTAVGTASRMDGDSPS